MDQRRDNLIRQFTSNHQKMWDRSCFSSTGLKGGIDSGFSVRVELELLEYSSYIQNGRVSHPQYGTFAILGEQVKEYARRTGCSNWVADWTLQDQLYLSELRWEHPGWITAQKQEWGLFMLEHLLHNVASMRRKEHQRCSQALQVEMAKAMVTKHPSIQTFVESPDSEILKITEKVYQGSM